ncbi:hypothetical protein [Actinoplanes sp. GCM10030250]|uniref:hypothetical protein n=1 Tax=Actinoplanes sp. GCM10030250 TaxID=3273376 RepID=UPI003614A6DB
MSRTTRLLMTAGLAVAVGAGAAPVAALASGTTESKPKFEMDSLYDIPGNCEDNGAIGEDNGDWDHWYCKKVAKGGSRGNWVLYVIYK